MNRCVNTKDGTSLSALIYWRNNTPSAIRQCGGSILQLLYFPNSILHVFFSVNPAMPNNAEWFGASIGNAHYKGEKSHGLKCRALPIYANIAYWLCFTGAETEIEKIKDDTKIKRQTNLYRRGPRPIMNVCHLPDPPPFSLPTTFLAPQHCLWLKNPVRPKNYGSRSLLCFALLCFIFWPFYPFDPPCLFKIWTFTAPLVVAEITRQRQYIGADVFIYLK